MMRMEMKYKRIRPDRWVGFCLLLFLAACSGSGSASPIPVTLDTEPPFVLPSPKGTASNTPGAQNRVTPSLWTPTVATDTITAPLPAKTSRSKTELPSEGIGFGRPYQFFVSPDGKAFAIASNADVFVFDSAALEEISHLPITRSLFARRFGLAFSPDGQALAIWDSDTYHHGVVHVWDFRTGVLLQTIIGERPEYGMGFSPDGTMLAMGAHVYMDPGMARYQIVLFDAGSGRKIRSVGVDDSDVPNYFAFSPDGKYLAIGLNLPDPHNQSGYVSFLCTVRIWDLMQFRQIQTLQQKCETNGVSYVDFSPDGKLLGVGFEEEVAFFGTGSWQKEFSIYSSMQEGDNLFAINPEGSMVATLFWGLGSIVPEPYNLVRLTDISMIRGWDSPQEDIHFDCPHAFTDVEFLDGGRKLGVVCTDRIYFWSVEEKQLLPSVGLRDGVVHVATIPEPPPLPFGRTLSLQNPQITGRDVWDIQDRLKDLGYSETGAADGIFGSKTEDAVRHFQRRNGLEEDGIVGLATWERLFSEEAISAI